MAERLPVTVVTGFLGAGKTTLVNRLLREEHGEQLAVLVNEFGDVGIDGSLVVRADEEVVELANGCICCTVRGDLVRAISGLLRKRRRKLFRRPFDRLLIETSGLASPGPILQTLRLEPELAEETVEAGVLTVVHGGAILEECERHPEVEEQIGYASLLLLNHADAVEEPGLARVEAMLTERNPTAGIERSVRAEIEVSALFRGLTIPEREPSPSHRHTEGAGSVVLRTEHPLDLHKLKMWLGFLAQERSHELWRMKGLLRCSGHPQAVIVQAVYQMLELGPSEDPAPAESTLVLIGRGLDVETLERGWETCRASG